MESQWKISLCVLVCMCDKLILKMHMEIQGPRVAKMILKKNKVRELTEPDFTYLTYYKAMINKTVWCFGKRIDK